MFRRQQTDLIVQYGYQNKRIFCIENRKKEECCGTLILLKVFTVGFFSISFRFVEVHYGIIPTAAIKVVCP